MALYEPARHPVTSVVPSGPRREVRNLPAMTWCHRPGPRWHPDTGRSARRERAAMDDHRAPPGRVAPATPRSTPGATPRGESRRAPGRFRRLNLVTLFPLLAVVGALLVARQAQTWVDALVLGLGLVAALVAFERWTAGDVLRVAVPCLVVSAAVWPYGALVVDGGVQGAYYALAIVSCLVIPELSRHRAAAAVAVGAYVAGVGTWGLLADGPPTTGGLVSQVIVPTGVTVVVIGLRFPNKGFYDVVRELEEARAREAELAVVRERMRFASDLHDIQGHTLHVVKLKIALAQRLVTRDPARAEAELRETYDLVGETSAQARELAYGRRRLNLPAELEHARHLLAAAGIHRRAARPPARGGPASALPRQGLRQATPTADLRRSGATLVHGARSERGITVVNDGVAGGAAPRLRGLATLARRVADDGGVLTAEVVDGRFRTSVTLPAARRGAGASDGAAPGAGTSAARGGGSA